MRGSSAIAELAADALILLLRLAFALLLYLFLFRLLVALRRDLGRDSRSDASRNTAAEPEPQGRLIVLESRSGGVKKGASLLIAPVTVIGRSLDSQIRLDDKLVSARHARLRRLDGCWFLEDLQSTNGTLLNQEPVVGEQPVEYGDVIGVGDVRLKLAH